LQDVGVDGVRDDVEGERDSLDDESEKPGKSELLPSPLSWRLFLWASFELLAILPQSRLAFTFESSLLDPLSLADPLSFRSPSNPLNNPAPQSPSPKSTLKWKLSLGGNVFISGSFLSITSGGVGLMCLFNSAGSMSLLGRGREISV
jgi:hypothetical protein